MGFRYNGQLFRQSYYDQSYDVKEKNKKKRKSTRRFIHCETVKSSTHRQLSLEDQIFLESIGLTINKEKR